MPPKGNSRLYRSPAELIPMEAASQEDNSPEIPWLRPADRVRTLSCVGGGGVMKFPNGCPKVPKRPDHPAVQGPEMVGEWPEASRFLRAWLRRTFVLSWVLKMWMQQQVCWLVELVIVCVSKFAGL
jgi:hypothetical protein